MPYATAAQFIEAFGEEEVIHLTNLDDVAAQLRDDSVLNRALVDGESVINSLIRGRYPLPLDPAPPELTPINLDISRYRLDRNRPREDVRLRYEDAMRWLRDVAKGLVSLTVPDDAPTAGDSAYVTRPRYFSDENLRGY
ncbi:MAG: DUF1320 domain-containing protein [Cyanobacteria bacterium J06638_20]